MDGTGSPHEFIMDMDGTADMQSINATFFDEVSSYGCRILDGLAAFDVIAGIDTAENRHLAARLIAHIFNEHAVFKAATKFIDTVIGTGRNESADQVAVCTVYFDHIDTGTLSAGSGITVTFNQFVDFFAGNSNRYFTT